MLKHYSHIRMEAKRRALESIVAKPTAKTATSWASVGEPPIHAVEGPYSGISRTIN